MSNTQCAVAGCSDQPYIEHPLPLCRRDALMVSIHVTDVLHANSLNGHTTTGLDIDQVSVASDGVWAQSSHPAVVYFLTNGDRVKIGTSTNITGRVSALALRRGNAALLLQGDHDLEGALHDHFESDRIGTTEWFVISPRIREYIKRRKDADATLRQPQLPSETPPKTDPGDRPQRLTKSATAEQKILKALHGYSDPLSLKTHMHRDEIGRQTGVWGSTLDNTLSRLVRSGQIHRGQKRGTYGLGTGLEGE
ncbi:GIY-YIG nuclease family protein [Streptomyces chiangmaiensis]|uniref:GIY-YIG nuclease family protein n=1 Tax=Streptomyces chiangmaiensis TaxID=766497 RepID=UPI0031EDB0C0